MRFRPPIPASPFAAAAAAVEFPRSSPTKIRTKSSRRSPSRSPQLISHQSSIFSRSAGGYTAFAVRRVPRACDEIIAAPIFAFRRRPPPPPPPSPAYRGTGGGELGSRRVRRGRGTKTTSACLPRGVGPRRRRRAPRSAAGGAPIRKQVRVAAPAKTGLRKWKLQFMAGCSEALFPDCRPL